MTWSLGYVLSHDFVLLMFLLALPATAVRCLCLCQYFEDHYLWEDTVADKGRADSCTQQLSWSLCVLSYAYCTPSTVSWFTAGMLRDCPAYQPTTSQLRFLLKWIGSDLDNAAAERQAALTLLRAVLGRKLVVPEVYDVMNKVQELMIK